MIKLPEGSAIVYCQQAFGTTNGKTAHGLVRRSERYTVEAVVDARHKGQDAGVILDGKSVGIPIYASVQDAIDDLEQRGRGVSFLVIGLAPDGGRLPGFARQEVEVAIRAGLNVDSGLHDFLTEDEEIRKLALQYGVRLRDVRKPPDRKLLHFFSGKIEEVQAARIAVLGTDSAVGKRTTAWLLVDALRRVGRPTELVGTGQTAWLQGARYSIILDSLVNDFVAGEIEHAVWQAWREGGAEVIVLEGQGSLMNPAYPGGFELLAAGRPHAIVLQHAPARKEYDGFPGYPLHDLPKQIEAIELLSNKPVVAITVNHENLNRDEVRSACAAIHKETGLPACDVLVEGADAVLEALAPYLGTSIPTSR